VTVAAGLGLVFGVAIAVTASDTNLFAKPQTPAPVLPRASGLKALPAAYTGPAPSLLSQVDPHWKASAASPLLSPVSDKPATKSGSAHKKHGMPELWTWMKGSGKLNDNASGKSGVSPIAPAAHKAPTALQMASAAETSGPFVLVIQGEATIAGFDAGTGRVETYEGQTFVLDKTAGETSAISWPDFPFNVHYRCDETGSCTLKHGGATAGAKLAR